MGMFKAVGSVYANMFNFSGRARRAEYWWYYLFVLLVTVIAQVGLGFWAFGQPDLLAAFTDETQIQLWMKEYQDSIIRWGGYSFVASLFLYWIPYLAVTVRRLHDTGRSGWWMFKPFLVAFVGAFALSMVAGFTGAASGTPSPALILLAVTLPLLASIWYIVVLCLPGDHGDNRFGPDPVPGRPRKETGHPALVKEMDEELGRMVEQRRKEEFSDYYRARVLPAIERNKARRTGTAQ